MENAVLLVDDNRDILKLLKNTLDTLKRPEIKAFEAPSGEEALLEAARRKIDLLITDYKLPGMTGVELMHKIRAKHPEVKVILISGMSDKKAREEMIGAGAMAIFDKPIPLADFLDAVERGLGLVQTIFPPEQVDVKTEARHVRLSDLLANFRQDFNTQAVFLISERGRVQARAGSLKDSSLEVSIVSALTAIHQASIKVSRNNHQEALDSYHVFQAGDSDLLFIPVDSLYALLVAGDGLANQENIFNTITGVLALRREVQKTLRNIGATGELRSISPKTVPLPPRQNAEGKPGKSQTARLKESPPAPEMEALLEASKTKPKPPTNLDDFWDQAAEQHGKKPANAKVISLEQAKEMGLFPDQDKK
ncbi:MAG: response regulator [Anaerolineales bacterium]|nr:response regulator [Anaerolineales bacterium]